MPTGAVVGIAVGVALFVAILCAVAFIWYRKRHVGPKGALDGDKASQEMLGHYQFPGHPMVQYPNAMYAQPTQMMPLYQFPPANPSPLAQPYDPPPGVSYELAAAYVQSQADVSELHAVSQTPTLAEPNSGADSGTPGANGQAEAKDVKPTQRSGAG